jgi:phosphatidylinositol alpha-1,6-mannosyltransferase
MIAAGAPEPAAAEAHSDMDGPVPGRRSHLWLIASDYKPSPGGIAAYLDGLARGLRGLDIRVDVLAVVEPDAHERIRFLNDYEEWVRPFVLEHDPRPKSRSRDAWFSCLEILRCVLPVGRRFVETPRFFANSIRAAARLRASLEHDRPQMVVLGHLDRRLYSLVIALREAGIPYGLIAHDVEIYKHPWRKLNDRVVRGMMIRCAEWIAANSRHTRRLLEEWGLDTGRIRIAHPPVAPEALAESAKPPTSPKTGPYTLVTICRLVYSKGIDVVLRALKILKEKKVPFQYIVAGDGDHRAALETLAAELGLGGRVRFLGFISDAQKWECLRTADVFVMPSRMDPKRHHEGFGIAYIEAAVFSVPSIGTDAGGVPDAVVHAQTGLLVEPESPERLADAIAYFYENPVKRKEMGMAARSRALSQFTTQSVACQFRDAFLQNGAG